MTNRQRFRVTGAEVAMWKKSLTRCAAAAGGAVLAVGPSDANAEVRYTDVTPDLSTQFITDSNSSTDVFFDLDGQTATAALHGSAPAGTDFRLNYTGDSAEKPEISFQAGVSNWASGQIAKIGTNFDYANMFGPMEEIGPSYNPPPQPSGTAWAAGGWLENGDAGPWHGGGPAGVNGVGTGFLGLRLDFDGLAIDYNYGWAQVRYDDNANIMTLLDFAIETTINAPITTPAITPPPVSLVGDFNNDLTVDGLDLLKWKGDFGINGGSDADADGDSDGADFLLWQRHLGESAASGAAAAVPEPHSLLLAAMGATGLLKLRRRER
jgi:hypothetical protein